MIILLEIRMNYDIDRTKHVNHFLGVFFINSININESF